ncbi:hypothetical protein [Loigolactobacillus iwatensis]|uniref:hypothetical protein n=1 Tax=Loigolactobacillus iwatensis TaxID=1267156 RepID=UPI000F7FA431|nr:hypothetical protein [Loigolactobacillus iwatensis]
MKISPLKLPGLYDCLIVCLLLLEIIIASLTIIISPLQHLLGFATFNAGLTEMTSKLVWLCWLGILLHLNSYFHALQIPAMMLANILGIAAFFMLWLLPYHTLIPLILLIIVIYLTLQTAQHNQAKQQKTKQTKKH